MCVAFLLLAACAVNPATGRREISLVSESREIQMGRDADPEITASLGMVDDPELQAYVTRLGDMLAATSERPALPWSFKVVDDPLVNAFALPGGFIYVTRGILAHFDSEAELVGVLGHEIGHVTAQHSEKRIRATLATAPSITLNRPLMANGMPRTTVIIAIEIIVPTPNSTR